ncbi:hypothetical protein Mgra_00003955 [Meloidogyne graminicola]|uniref:Muscle M-line assembly protein unc-89 n=1 Tax=Meloidogyne graminicola TaxID=189291 RepID=A0A8S9ZSW7_9BILA|nr:hypothetical protein Mgra_00003955 [Meloidogyne graminicola]
MSSASSTPRSISPCFNVVERSTGRRFLAQRKPLDDELERDIQMHNVLRESPDLAQLHQVLVEDGEAVLVYGNADRSFLDSLLPPPSRRSHSRSPSACQINETAARPSGAREEQVQIFVKQLLTALAYMHSRGIAHLDLRPEVILLQDDHLRLADFGQSRRLINGKLMGGAIKSNPEFVSPEIVAGTEPVTLAADMWSVGALTYVLLFGQSPFLGDNDEETLQNVLKGEFQFEESNQQISSNACEFVKKLLVRDPYGRIDVQQALTHNWLSDPSLDDAKLSTDCLREFKYRHQWLERRVFVQQTPSEQLTQMVEAPRSLCTASSRNLKAEVSTPSEISRKEPLAVYDYLNIRAEEQAAKQPHFAQQIQRHNKGGLSPLPQQFARQQFGGKKEEGQQQPPFPIPPNRRSQSPRFPTEPPPIPDYILSQLPPGVKKEHLRWDPYGGGFYLPLEFQPHGKGQGPPPPLPPRSRSSSSERSAPGGIHQQQTGPPQFAPLPPGISKKIEEMAAAASKKLKQQPPQQQQPTMSAEETKILEDLAKQFGITELKLEDLKNPQSPLMKLIRGERRQIQEELANRVLSDISEESAGGDSNSSVTQNSEHSSGTTTPRPQKQIPRRTTTPIDGMDADGEGSTTTTAEHEGPSSSTVTPLASPAFMAESPSPLNQKEQHFFPSEKVLDDISSPPEILDESQQHFTSKHLPLQIPDFGIKSPVQLSPRGEHTMSVQIVPKRDTPSSTNTKIISSDQKPSTFHPLPDTEFDLLMDAVNRVKRDQNQRIKEQKPKEEEEEKDLESYRPYSAYVEYEREVKSLQTLKNINKTSCDEDFAWESNYQIGPETLLVPTFGARFNARVRDYRRGIWGDSAAYVFSGELGARNTDVTVRERRRYTDLIREEPLVAKSVDNVLEGLLLSHEGAQRRIFNGNEGENISENIKNDDGSEKKFAPIFRSRLRDGYFSENSANVTMECQVIGNPLPEVTFFHHESAICEDGRHKISRLGNNLWRLTILNPIPGVDNGEYSCVASNELGRDKCVCKCIGGEPPNRPSRPEVELSADTEVFVSWEAPEKLPVTLNGTTYRIECRPAGERDAFATWTCLSNFVEEESVVIKHLLPQGIYQFRVTAKNEFGWGEPSIHSRIIRTHPRGVPKFNLDILRKEGRRFTVVVMPQKSKGAGLSEIQEELAEREEDEDDEGNEIQNNENLRKESLGSGSNGNDNGGSKKVKLNTSDDPLKRFQLDSELFRGQFSVIRYAIDSKTGSHCIVKIRASPTHGSLMFATPAERMKAALTEYETLSECQHENVVQLHAAYCSDNSFQLYFMERLHEDLFQRFVRLETYSEEQIAFVVRQIVGALRWIHFCGFVHGDVEPTNVMFTTKRAWHIKLIDFGRSRPIGSRNGSAGDGQILEEWTSPEILLLNSKSNNEELKNSSTKNNENIDNYQLANQQNDMWGVGLITFCLLAGFHPFADETDSPKEIRHNVLEQRCDPNLIPVQASEEALRFVFWALKKQPSRRMRTDEALDHRWLAADQAMVRRRENIKYGSYRLVRTAKRRLHHQCQFARNGVGGRTMEKDENGFNQKTQRPLVPELKKSNNDIVPNQRIVSAEC